jgi:adenylate kinase family enzyme
MRIAIMGNAGSGKTTLARSLAGSGVAVLDLDTIAWEPNAGAILRPIDAAHRELQRFCSRQSDWIVEGCYGDLIEAALRWQPELIFLNPGKEVCLRNCRNRPWEPNKYRSKAEQDANLETLLEWISAYYTCAGSMSLAGHRATYDAYNGPKRELTDKFIFSTKSNC